MSGLKLINLPWTFTRQDLSRFLGRTLNTRPRFTKILYDNKTGLSRGIGIAYVDNEEGVRSLIRRGQLQIDGRSVMVNRTIDSKNPGMEI